MKRKVAPVTQEEDHEGTMKASVLRNREQSTASDTSDLSNLGTETCPH